MVKNSILLFFFTVFFIACKKDFSERIQKEIAKKTLKFEREQKSECRKALLDKATRIVDSTLLAEAIAAGIDTSTVSSRLRPEKPESIETFDSLEVKPIFEPER